MQVFEDLSEDIVIPSEPTAFEELMKPKTDKETNTECVFVKPTVGGARPKVKDLVKRSKTFNYVDVGKGYSNVKLNRSDSDGAMPLYKKLPFQHNLAERRSLRLPTKFNLMPTEKAALAKKKSENPEVTKLQLKRSRRLARTKEHVLETPLDLELDLAAQKTKLDLLQSDISRLKDIQSKLEEAKSQGGVVDSWLQDHEYLQNLLSKVTSISCLRVFASLSLRVFKIKSLSL